MRKTRVVILFGGQSEEHGVSVKSAIEVAGHLDTDRYEPFYVGITRGGAWRLCEAPRVDWEADDCRPAFLSPDRATGGLLVWETDGYRPLPIDVVFPVLHGKTGEDGAIQGLLTLSGLPYVGCDIQSSAVCMDKSLAYLVAQSAGISTPAFQTIGRADPLPVVPPSYPVFVKPARSGSSFGVSKVTRPEDLAAAVDAARAYDDKVLIEQAVCGEEVGCAVLGHDGDMRVGEVDQIRLSHGFFRIHQERSPQTGSENARVTVPANLPASTRGRIQETAKTLYVAIGCKGLARVDLFLQANGRIVLNEINTLPGFTVYSRYPRMMAAAGLPLSDVIDRLIALAMKG